MSLSRLLTIFTAILTLATANAAAAEHLPNGVEAARGPLRVRVTALTDSIVRVRVARDGNFGEDASWAVPAAVRRQALLVSAISDGFQTKAVAVHLDPNTLSLAVTDPSGRIIVADEPEPIRLDGRGFTLTKALPIDEHIFGLGDKTGSLDRRGGTFVDWNTDAFGFAPWTDPIYKSIPFYIGVNGDGVAYGLFLDNSWRVSFDFGHKDASAIEIGAPDGPIDYYLIAGPTVADVVRRYTDLTGRAPLAPEWALGYQQSRWGYKSDADIRGIASRLRSDRIPADVIWMDIDYQDRDRPFTVNTKAFPDLKKLNSDMNAEGIRLVAITDLHIAYLPNQGYAPFDSGMAGHDFVRKADGSLYVAPVWPGPSVFPDFTRAATRAWWGGLYKDFIADGFAGFEEVGRVGGDEADRAGKAVAAVERRRGAAQNLDRFDEAEVDIVAAPDILRTEAEAVGDAHAIDLDQHAIAADATDVETVVARAAGRAERRVEARGLVLNADAGLEANEVADIGYQDEKDLSLDRRRAASARCCGSRRRAPADRGRRGRRQLRAGPRRHPRHGGQLPRWLQHAGIDALGQGLHPARTQTLGRQRGRSRHRGQWP